MRTSLTVGLVAAFALLASAGSAQAALNLPTMQCSYSFNSNLSLGTRSASVMDLQKVLNMYSETKVASTGAGSPGMETSYFGPATKAAVIKFQAVNSVSPTSGLVGPLTRAVLNQVCTGTTVPPTTGLPAGCTSTAGYSPVTGQSCASGNTGAQTGPVSVSLSSTNPASTYVMNSQATAGLLDLVFTGNGTVNSVTLTRSGISDQNTLANIYLYDGGTRLTDGYSFNSNGQVVINNVNLAVNGSKTISVKADLASTASSTASTVAVALTSFTSGTSVNAVNVQGNLMSIASGSSLATIQLTGSNTVGASSVNAGTLGYTVWRHALQVNTRAVSLKAANFRVTGSAPSNSLANARLYVNGVDTGKVASMTVIGGSNYLSFDLMSAPLSLPTGSHTVEVRADVVSGSSYNLTVSLQQASDLMVMDPQIGANIALASFTTSQSGLISIFGGNVTQTINPAFNATTNVTGGASNAVIGKWTLRGFGEDVKVRTISVTPALTGNLGVSGSFSTTATTPTLTTGAQTWTVATTVGMYAGQVLTTTGATTQATATVTSITNGTTVVVNVTTAGTGVATGVASSTTATGATGLQNVTVYFNGSQVGTQTASWTAGAINLNLGSQMIIPAGVDSTLEVKADLRSTGGANFVSGTVSSTTSIAQVNVEGMSSRGNANFPTTLTGAAKTLTIQTGLLGVATNSAFASGQNINPNTSAVRIGSFVLQNQSSSESVRVTTLAVALTETTTTAFTNYASLYTSKNMNPVQPQASNSFSVDFTLAPSATEIVDVFVNTNAATSGTIASTLTVTSIGVASNVSATSSAITGQTMNLGSGAVQTPTFTASASSSAQYVAAAGGATDVVTARYNITSNNGSSTISELKFTTTGTAGAITSVKVGNVSAPVIANVAWLTGLNIAVPQGGSGANIDVMISYSNVGINGIASGSTAGLNLTYVKGTSGGITTELNPSIVSNTMTVVGSKPTLALTLPLGAAGSSVSGLSVGTKYVADVRVSADAKGDIKVNTIGLTFTGNAAGTTSNGAAAIVKDKNGSTIATAVVTGTAGQNATATLTFTGGYTISANTTETFKIELPVTGIAGASSSIATGLGANTTFTWTDTAGNAGGAVNGSLILNYPTSSVSMTN